MKGLRQAHNRINKYGYTVTFHDPSKIDAGLTDELTSLMRLSRQGEHERGFSMMLGRVFDPRDTGLLLTVVRTPDGAAAAMCQFVPATGINGFSLDLMRRDPGDHPNGLLDFALCSTIEHLAARGFEGLSLNFAAMRSTLAGEKGDGTVQRAERWFLKRLSNFAQIESLWKFNAKYEPEWLPRYVVFDTAEHLVPVVMAILRAESLWEIPVLGRLLAAGAEKRMLAAQQDTDEFLASIVPWDEDGVQVAGADRTRHAAHRGRHRYTAEPAAGHARGLTRTGASAWRRRQSHRVRVGDDARTRGRPRPPDESRVEQFLARRRPRAATGRHAGQVVGRRLDPAPQPAPSGVMPAPSSSPRRHAAGRAACAHSSSDQPRAAGTARRAAPPTRRRAPVPRTRPGRTRSGRPRARHPGARAGRCSQCQSASTGSSGTRSPGWRRTAAGRRRTRPSSSALQAAAPARRRPSVDVGGHPAERLGRPGPPGGPHPSRLGQRPGVGQGPPDHGRDGS